MTESFNVAIVTGDPAAPSQTFVRRHVAHLFAGNTVIISTKGSSSIVDRPILILQPKNPWERRKQRLFHRLFKAQRDQRVTSFLKAHDVKFILAEFGGEGLKIFRQAKSAGIPMYCYFRGYDASRMLNDRKYVSELREMCRHIKGIVAVSRSLLANLAAAGIVCRKHFVIPSGVDTEGFAPREKNPNSFLTVGRFVEKKSPELTIRAFASAAASNPAITLDMIGDGPLLEPCCHLAERLGLAERIKSHGALSSNEVRQIMAQSRFFLQHSVVTHSGDTEGMPSAVQEALSCGCIVISSRHAGVPEHITHNFNGVLVEERDVAGYASEINRLHGDTRLADCIARNARAYALAQLDYRKLYRRLETEILAEVRECDQESAV